MKIGLPALRVALLPVAIAVVALVAAVAFNTLRQDSRQLQVDAVAPGAIDSTASVARLAGALRLRTISRDAVSDTSADQFLALHAYLRRHYPHAHAALSREVVNRYSLLYAWAGEDSSAKPILLMAHQDVVPIAPGTARDWQAEPFSGAIRDGYVWGRGAWDDKGSLMAIMEAVERLAAQGFRPRQTVYLAFGHDEENGGERGAKAIAALLRARGVRLDFVLDEGPWVTEGVVRGLAKPLALVGTAEKGIATLALRTSAAAGHASMPAPSSAIGTLGKALARLEDAPMRAGMHGATAEMFDTIAPEMTGFERIVLSNRWLFGPLLMARLQDTPTTNAMLRTTAALTVIQAGNKRNVVPKRAEALVNVRLLPGDTVEDVLTHARKMVNDDRVEIRIDGVAHEASPVSSSGSPAFHLIERTVRQTFPDALVAPGLVIGGTDSRHMQPLADNVYRFTPVRARSEDFDRYHGSNERISIANYAEMIGFYMQLLVNTETAYTPRTVRSESRTLRSHED